MPWIDETLCTGCGVCIAQCPVDAIALEDDNRAEINDSECIRCGRCHDVCPQEAVRHDSERIPQEVAQNLQWVRRLLGHFSQPEEQAAFMQRMVRFFNKEKTVSERTLAAIRGAEGGPGPGLDAAIGDLAAARGGPTKG